MSEAELYSAVPSCRQLYISYLQTATIVDCIISIEERLSTRPTRLSHNREILLWDVRDDLRRELAGRQLVFPIPENA